jgi:hypothetical protein
MDTNTAEYQMFPDIGQPDIGCSLYIYFFVHVHNIFFNVKSRLALFCHFALAITERPTWNAYLHTLGTITASMLYCKYKHMLKVNGNYAWQTVHELNLHTSLCLKHCFCSSQLQVTLDSILYHRQFFVNFIAIWGNFAKMQRKELHFLGKLNLGMLHFHLLRRTDCYLL